MPKIFVIDDEKGARDLLGRFLETKGYEVFFAQDGLGGIGKIRTEGTSGYIIKPFDFSRLEEKIEALLES